jgi:hypothetical protein
MPPTTREIAAPIRLLRELDARDCARFLMMIVYEIGVSPPGAACPLRSDERPSAGIPALVFFEVTRSSGTDSRSH